MKRSLIALYLLLSACQTKGGVVLPSIEGQIDMARICRQKAPDIIPNEPFISQNLYDENKIGSISDALEYFLMGFETIEFNISDDTINNSNLFPNNDPTIWGHKTLGKQKGILNTSIVKRPHEGCFAFEETIDQLGKPDSARFFTITDFGPSSPRNWCINSFSYDQSIMQFHYAKTIQSTPTSGGFITEIIETLNKEGALVARRTQIFQSRPQFPIGVINVNTDCNNKAITELPQEFIGPNGIALRPLRAPALIIINPQ